MEIVNTIMSTYTSSNLVQFASWWQTRSVLVMWFWIDVNMKTVSHYVLRFIMNITHDPEITQVFTRIFVHIFYSSTDNDSLMLESIHMFINSIREKVIFWHRTTFQQWKWATSNNAVTVDEFTNIKLNDRTST